MQQDSQKIRDLIFSRSYNAVGIAPYGVLADQKVTLEQWIADGNHAEKDYFLKNPRHDPHTILPSCRSLVVILFAPQREKYHSPIRRELKRLLKAIQEIAPEVQGRGVVDTAPIMEKEWARRAGLGTVGRNTLLVHPDLGTNFNIGILLLDVELPYDEPFVRDLCPTGCAKCVEQCPTGALLDNRTLDCRVCLSYISQITPGADYGCLVCQKACPFNV